MEYRWMWYYLRRDTEYEICNICNLQYNSPHCSGMVSHVSQVHHIIASLEKPYTPIQNNGVKCRYCPLILMASITPCKNIQNHLTKIHKLNKDIANKLKIWVNQKLDIIEKCETCEQFETLDIFNLMVHLYRIHGVTVPPEFIPKSLENCTWMWYYLRSDTENEICNICNYKYIIAHHINMSTHVLNSHPDLYNPSPIHDNYTRTKTNGVKCNYCSQIYMPFLNPSIQMYNHLTKEHELNEKIANELEIWINDQLPLIEKCESCGQFKKSGIFNLIVHLHKVHSVTVPQKFIPSRNTVDIPTSSSNQQPTCSTSNTDDENFNSNLNPAITVESTKENNWTDFMHVTGNLPDIAPSSSLLSIHTAENMSDVQESSMEYSWMWYYLRIDTEYEICNICNMRYKSFHCSQMLTHLIRSHSITILENNFTRTQNNGIKCNHCPIIYMASMNPCQYIQKHLTNKHNLNKDTADKLKIWVNQKLDIIEKCDTCEQFEELDIFNLMVHLHRIHDVTVPPEFIPTGLKNCTWMWYYLRSDTKNEICNICNHEYTTAHDKSMVKHVSSHSGLYNPLAIHDNYTSTKTNGLKCNHCSTIYMPSLNPCTKIQKHIIEYHELKEDIANELKTWVNVELSLIENCESCDQFKKFDIFNIMVHLVEAHRVIVLSKFIPTGLSQRLSNTFHRNRNTVDIPMSSSNQQPTCSTSNTDDENFNSNLNSAITVESTEEDNWTDSMHDSLNLLDIAPSRSFSSFDDTDESMSNVQKSVSKIVRKLLHDDGNNVDSSTLNSNQQATCSTWRTDDENVGSHLNPDRIVESTEEDNWMDCTHIAPDSEKTDSIYSIEVDKLFGCSEKKSHSMLSNE